jgi:ribonuclease Z
LIHEATFEDGMTEEAVDKRHSTTTEAIESATKMNAHFLMMNHFSQRYPKIPVFDQKYTNSTGVAFDLMTVRMRDFPILPKFLNCLQHLFPEEPEEKEAVEPEPRIHTQQVKQKQKQGPSADRASTPNKKSKLVQ